jgi:hypothetical protein
VKAFAASNRKVSQRRKNMVMKPRFFRRVAMLEYFTSMLESTSVRKRHSQEEECDHEPSDQVYSNRGSKFVGVSIGSTDSGTGDKNEGIGDPESPIRCES